jgi:hypothetical protein
VINLARKHAKENQIACHEFFALQRSARGALQLRRTRQHDGLLCVHEAREAGAVETFARVASVAIGLSDLSERELRDTLSAVVDDLPGVGRRVGPAGCTGSGKQQRGHCDQTAQEVSPSWRW